MSNNGWAPAEISGRFHSTTKIQINVTDDPLIIAEIGSLEIDATNGRTIAEHYEATGKMSATKFREYYGDFEADQLL